MISSYSIEKKINGYAPLGTAGDLGKTENGGKGSGNFGHAGREGKVGGSAPSGSGSGKSHDDKTREISEKLSLVEDSISDLLHSNPHSKQLEKLFEEQEKLKKEQERLSDDLNQSRSDFYRDYLKYERTDDGRYVRKQPDTNDKAYKESLAKIKESVDKIRKTDSKSEDKQIQKDNAKISRIEEKIGKKALLVAKDFEGSSISTFMDEDGKEYWYDKHSERVKDYGGEKEYRSPAFDKAMKDKTPWNEYEITGAQIKKKLKDYGINTDGLSISKGRGGYETAWHISGSSIKTDLKAVEDIVKTKIGHVDYDERSGEILAGGNTYVFVSDNER